MRLCARIGEEMKKTITVLFLVAVLLTSICVLIACEDEEATIESYQDIEKKIYAVGDTYNSSDVVIIANLKDGTTRKITKNLVFVGDDEETLKLEDGKFTTAGVYNVTVYALEEREDYKIGVWTIEVRD